MANQRMFGKAAIVTVGDIWLGTAVCSVLAREGASVAVVGAGGNCNDILRQLSIGHNNKHCVVNTSITDNFDVERTFRAVEKVLKKKCTVLVNCAEIVRRSSIGNTMEVDFDEVIAYNLKGTFLMSKAFVNSLKDSEDNVRGTLVNLSNVGSKAGIAFHSAYAASQAAVTALTKTIAMEFFEHRIRSNVILLGIIEPPPSHDAGVHRSREEVIRGTIPMRRFAHPEEIANAVLFLASEESSYVNGACLEVGGGYGM